MVVLVVVEFKVGLGVQEILQAHLHLKETMAPLLVLMLEGVEVAELALLEQTLTQV
jgi:hypothetical protein